MPIYRDAPFARPQNRAEQETETEQALIFTLNPRFL